MRKTIQQSKHQFDVPSEDPTIECIALIQQVLNRCSNADHKAVRAWFIAATENSTRDEWFPSIKNNLQ